MVAHENIVERNSYYYALLIVNVFPQNEMTIKRYLYFAIFQSHRVGAQVPVNQ